MNYSKEIVQALLAQFLYSAYQNLQCINKEKDENE